MHPAARMTTVPAKKMASSRRLGEPSLASAIPHSVGAANRKVPMGLSKRMISSAARHLDGAPRSGVFNEVEGSLKGLIHDLRPHSLAACRWGCDIVRSDSRKVCSGTCPALHEGFCTAGVVRVKPRCDVLRLNQQWFVLWQ